MLIQTIDDPQDAEDAVHLAFLSLANCRLLPELGPQARHLAAVTAERKAIDLYRSRKRRPERSPPRLAWASS